MNQRLKDLKVRAYDLVFEIKEKQDELNKVSAEINQIITAEKSGIVIGTPEDKSKKKNK